MVVSILCYSRALDVAKLDRLDFSREPFTKDVFNRIKVSNHILYFL
jgi:hypothetical protein